MPVIQNNLAPLISEWLFFSDILILASRANESKTDALESLINWQLTNLYLITLTLRKSKIYRDWGKSIFYLNYNKQFI